MRNLAVLFALSVVLNISHSAAHASLYSVGGLALGAKVVLGSAAYREYQCVRSEKFEGFVWCAKSSNDKESRGPFKVWSSIMHAEDGTVVYVNRYQEPAYWGANEVTDDIQRYSHSIGEEPQIIQMPTRPGLPKGTLATWGKVVLEPIGGEELKLLAEGRPLGEGIPIDFIGDFARSARQGLPVYRLSGGAGFVWAASYNETGRGTLRFSAVDASAYSRQTLPPAETTAPAIAAAPPISPRSGAPVTSGLASGQSGQPTQVGPTRQTTPNVVQAQARPRSEPATRPTIAASPAEEFRNLVIAQGGCMNIHLFSNGLIFPSSLPNGPNGAILYGTPLVDWSDGDVAAVIRFYKDCVEKNHAAAVEFCLRSGNRDCEKRVSASESVSNVAVTLEHRFESTVGSIVMGARNLENQRKEQQTAQIELANAEAQRKRDQATKDAQQKQEQLREQAKRDKEAAEATDKLAEREEPKIAEATREAEAARQARHVAEQRLAEIRSRMEAQETARKQQADQDAAEQKQRASQEATDQNNLPINILRTAYAAYVDVKRCQEAREGYQLGYISNPEMDQAKDAVLTIEQTMKSKLDQNTTTDDVWSRVATTEGRNFHPSGDYQEGTRSLCRGRLALLLGMLREQVPETGVMRKDF